MTDKFQPLTGSARLAGVIGWPVSHSRSPRLHGYWLAKYQIDGAYLPLCVSPENFAEAVSALPLLGFAGANVTVPHKEAALAIADRTEEFAQRVGAANTLVFGADGRIHASNTDGYGFMENLRGNAPSWRAKSGPAVVIGAGGASRAIIAALLNAGVPEVRVANRTMERADAVASQLGGAIKVVDWERRNESLDEAGILVNTTKLGMEGAPPLDIRLKGLPDDATVCDIVYTPLETALLANARARGLTAVDGLGMLLHQARPGFAAWFDRQPDVDEALRQFVLEDLA